MAVLSNAIWRATPGRVTDFIQVAGQAKAIHERLGAKAFLIQWSNAGSNSGAFGYGLIFADLAAWGRFADAAATDSAWQAFQQQNLNTPNPTATLLSQSISNDLPGFEAPDAAAPGTFVLAVNAQLAAGRNAAEAVGLVTSVKPVALALGAQWMRSRRVGIGGESTLAFTTTIGFANAAAYADWQMKYTADPRGQALQQATHGPGSPFTGITHATGRVLPL